MKIRFLYFEECPSHEEALERLRKILTEESVQAAVDIVRVETSEEARELRFPGSPTILIDGQDIDPQPNAQYALTCRAYRLEDGRISPLPSVSMIRRAIRSARKLST